MADAGVYIYNAFERCCSASEIHRGDILLEELAASTTYGFLMYHILSLEINSIFAIGAWRTTFKVDNAGSISDRFS